MGCAGASLQAAAKPPDGETPLHTAHCRCCAGYVPCLGRSGHGTYSVHARAAGITHHLDAAGWRRRSHRQSACLAWRSLMGANMMAYRLIMISLQVQLLLAVRWERRLRSPKSICGREVAACPFGRRSAGLAGLWCPLISVQVGRSAERAEAIETAAAAATFTTAANVAAACASLWNPSCLLCVKSICTRI